MKHIVLPILKFTALFIPAYIAIGYFTGEGRAKILSQGIFSAVGQAALLGLAVGTVFVAGLWLVDKIKNKEKSEELE